MDQSISRVAFVGNTAWSMYNFRLGVMKALLDDGIEVVVIAPYDSYVEKLISTGCSFHALYLKNYSTNPFQDIQTLFQLIKLYKKTQPDFIFHYTIKPNIYGTLAAKYCNITSIAITTGLGHLFYKNKIVTLTSTFLYRLVGKYSKEVWFLNQEDLTIFLRKKITQPQKSFLLNSEGVNTKYFAPLEVEKNNNKFIFLYAGRILRDKGIGLLAEASKRLKQKYNNFEIQILGFIDENNPNSIPLTQLNTWEKEGLIKYREAVEDVRLHIAKADCIVFPSFYKEGVSRVLLEASSMEIPIITTDWVGCREVVEHSVNGFLCAIKDVNSLVEKMEMFMEMTEEERQIMGINGRKKILREFEESLVIKRYYSVLNLTYNTRNWKEIEKGVINEI